MYENLPGAGILINIGVLWLGGGPICCIPILKQCKRDFKTKCKSQMMR